MNKWIILFISIMLACTGVSSAQSGNDNPLADSQIIHKGNGNEIIGLNYNGWPDFFISLDVLKYYEAMDVTPTDTLLPVLTFGEGAWPGDEYGFTHDIIHLDADGDGLSEIVAVWESDGRLEVVAMQADPNLLGIEVESEWSKHSWLSIGDPPLYHGKWWLPSQPLLAAGDFTGDGKDGFVLAHWTVDNQQDTWLHLALYELGDELEMTMLASAMDLMIPVPPAPDGLEAMFTLFEMTSGDFNGDGVDEILVVGRENGDPAGWDLNASIYSYEAGNTTLTRNRKDLLYRVRDTDTELFNVSVMSGYLNSTIREQAVVCLSEIPVERTRPDTLYVYMIGLGFNATYSETTVSEPWLISELEFWPHLGYKKFMMTGGDINGNGLEEILAGSGAGDSYKNLLSIYQLSGDFQITSYANLDSIPGVPYFDAISLGYVKEKIPGVHQIPYLIASGYEFTALLAFDIDDNGLFEGITPAARGAKGFRMVLSADLDGDIRLGSPRRSNITKILQPLVILNAPPGHFDVLGGISYDVSKIYNQNEPKFVSTYEKETSQTEEVQTTFYKDWGLSATLSGGGSYFGVSVSAHLTASYGEQFSKDENSSKTVTVNISVDAIEDDRIYATVMDYNVWEYPVYGNGIEKGHVLVVEPVVTENRWFPSKSWSGYSYIPDHEVGNILSYREYPQLTDNPALDEKIKGDYNNSFVLDGNSAYNWSLQFDDFLSSGASTQKEFGADWGATIGAWGVSASVDGYYSQEEMKTQRTEISEGLYLGVHLDALDMSLGEVSYRVTPYSYWADYGALVLDYAVQPELAQPGGTNTWWQRHYMDRPDPGFILPWRYDPEKGFTLEDPAKRYQTKDITFFPENPREGDVITITARIHNYSLISTSGPVGISFYIGDPDDGGILIEDEEGATRTLVPSIPARGMQMAEMKWTVPGNIGTYPRIYGVIDPEGVINEIHDNNNKGWSILGKTDVVSVEDDQMAGLPAKLTLNQNYPNPFNPSTTFAFAIPEPGMVSIDVYDILGRNVARVFSEHFDSGNHNRSWNADGLASGLYIYRITAGGHSLSGKMLLMK